jgi:hypothetical protein
MKVQQLAQGPKASTPSRSAKAGAAEGKSSDFADVLTDARKKPEPETAKAEAAPVKKAPLVKKAKAAKKDATCKAEDAVAVEDGAEVGEAPDAAPVEGEAIAEAEVDGEAIEADGTEKGVAAQPNALAVDPQLEAMAAQVVAQQAAPAPKADDAAFTVDADATTVA